MKCFFLQSFAELQVVLQFHSKLLCAPEACWQQVRCGKVWVLAIPAGSRQSHSPGNLSDFSKQLAPSVRLRIFRSRSALHKLHQYLE